jgi:hypothetical protein
LGASGGAGAVPRERVGGLDPRPRLAVAVGVLQLVEPKNLGLCLVHWTRAPRPRRRAGMTRIEPRPGLEVFVNKSGTVSISQITDTFPNEDPIVTVHPDDVPQLIRMLKATATEARETGPELEEESPADLAANG